MSGRTTGLQGTKLALSLLVVAGLLQAPVSAGDTAAPSKPALKPLIPQEAPTESSDAPSTTKSDVKGLSASGDLIPKSDHESAPKPAPDHKAAATGSAMPPKAPPINESTQVSELEKIMFGAPQPAIPLEYRLDRLESEVFHQTNPEWPAEKRIARLEKTLIGGGAPASQSAASAAAEDILNMSREIQSQANSGLAAPYANPYLPPLPTVPNMQLDGGAAPPQQTYIPIPENLDSAEYNKPLSRQQLEQFALKVVNDARYQQGLQELTWDPLSHKVAGQLVNDLCKRNTVSHADADGNNPDVRYTRAGGTDCMVESLVGIHLKSRPRPNKALVYAILKELTSHQDDRDALLSKHATHFAFTFDISSSNDKIVACAETITKQANVEPIPHDVQVGDKVDVRGVLAGQCKFSKITVAWEGTPPPDDSQDQDEAAPYFPPLDYEAYARKAEHDYQKAAKLLQLGGIGLALAGGVFIPPVALAAPLIAASGSAVRPKAISEIPVHGGVHCEGQVFEYKTPVSKDNKEGIYYITVWAQEGEDPTPFAVSRRAVIAKAAPGAADQKQSAKPGKEIANRDKKETKRTKHGD